MEIIYPLLEGRQLPSKLLVYIEHLIQSGDEKLLSLLERPLNLEILLKPLIVDFKQVHWKTSFDSCSLYDAHTLSLRGRADFKEKDSDALTYGEVPFETFAMILCNSVDMRNQRIFYDLGSGAGRAVYAASILHDWDANGIELIPDLVQAARSHCLTATQDDSSRSKINFMEGDLRQIDWSEADLVWVTSLCFDDGVIAELTSLSELMKEGSYILTTDTELDSDHWDFAAPPKLYKMSWGYSIIYVHRKNRGPRISLPGGNN